MVDTGFLSGVPVPRQLATANQLYGMKSDASDVEWKSILAGAGITIAHAARAITLSAALSANGLGYHNVMDYGAIGNGVTDDTAAIQAAIDACPIYGTVFAPTGDYLISSTITITKPIRLIGQGFGTIFYVASTVDVTTDIFHVIPETDGHYFEFRDFCVAPKAAWYTTGRHAIYLDGTNVYIGDAIFYNLQLYGLSGNAIYGDGGGAEGTPVLSTIETCVLVGGMAFPEMGDTVRIINCHMTGTGSYALNATCVSGASTLIFKGNSVTNDKGIRLGGPLVMPVIVDNEFETFDTFIGSNGAFLDLDGAAGADVTDAIIARNSFQIINGITTDSIRVNRAARTHIYANRLSRGATTSKEITITAEASDTIIGQNTWPSGAPVISDLGANTTSMLARAMQAISFGASGVDAEQIRFNRAEDAYRYNSIYSCSNDGGAAYVTVRVHDGVSNTSQKPVMGWFGTGLVRFLVQPNIYANNAAALAAGLVAGDVYRTGADPDVLCVVHAET